MSGKTVVCPDVESRQGRAGRFFTLGIVAVLMMVGGGFAGVLPAKAAEGVAVDAITSIEINETTVSQYSSVGVDIEWRAPAGTNPGDYFTLELPREFTNLIFGELLLQTPAPDNATVAVCDVADQSLTCVFTDYVARYGEVTGNLHLNISAAFASGDNPGSWKLNGKDLPYDVPNVDPSDNGPFPPADRLSKWGAYSRTGEGVQVIQWVVNIASEQFIVGDTPVTITDEMDPRLTLYPSPDNPTVTVRFADAAGWSADTFTSMTQDQDYSLDVTTASSFVLKFNDSPVVDQAIALAKAKNLMLQVIYQARPLVPGQEGTYSNSVTGKAGEAADSEFSWQDTGGQAGGTTAKVQLLKTDGVSDDGLQGAEFELRAGSDGTGPVLFSDLVTDLDGYLSVQGLSKGSYSFVETKAPTGYKLAGPLSFVIDDATFDLEDDTLMLAFPNDRLLGSVVWNKVDSETTDVLAGSEWLLIGPSGERMVIVDNGENDSSAELGVLQVGELPWGDYQLIETKAPEGYGLENDPIEFSVSASSLSVDLGQVTNVATEAPPQPTPQPVTPTTPEKPHSDELPVTGANFGVLSGAALLFILGTAFVAARASRRKAG